MIKPTDNKSAAPAMNPSTNSFSPIFATIAITILDRVNRDVYKRQPLNHIRYGLF